MHGRGDEDRCGAALLERVISRRGDPALMLETSLLSRLFRVCPLQGVFPYGMLQRSSKPPQKMKLSELLAKLDPSMAEACACDESVEKYCATMGTPHRVAVMTTFSALLPSMGLRYADPQEEMLRIVADDPARDYGYGAGAAVRLRAEGWGRGAADLSLAWDASAQAKTADDMLKAPAAVAAATRTAVLAMLAAYSVRPDLALELLSRLATERFAAEAATVKVADPASDDTATRTEICQTCFSLASRAFLFARVMLMARNMIPEPGAPGGPDAPDAVISAARRKRASEDETCKCGFSKMRIRVVAASSATARVVEIDTCPYYIVLAWQKGCGAWRVQ